MSSFTSLNMRREFSKCLSQLCAIFIIISGFGYGAISCPPPSNAGIPNTDPALLIVSYDGFRPEYLQRGVTPHMNKFRREGTFAESVRNVFQTKTFPNHHSMATVSPLNLVTYICLFVFLLVEAGLLSADTRSSSEFIVRCKTWSIGL